MVLPLPTVSCMLFGLSAALSVFRSLQQPAVILQQPQHYSGAGPDGLL
jgi:hypothetical protein